MSAHKNIDLICVVVLVLALLLTVLFLNGTALGMQAVVDEDAEQNSDSMCFTANDLNGDWQSSQSVTITLEGDGGTVSGNGAYFLDGDLVIAGGGWYVLSGELTDGSIIVDAYDSSKVYLKLDGVSITCSDDACIRVEQADKVFLTLAEGSENALVSGAAGSEAALSDGVDGVIFARDDLTINGSGSLTVTGGWKHGIAANDDLVITGGDLTVEAAADAIHANDSFRLCEAALHLTAGDDGIAVTNAEEGEGCLYMESGSIDLTAGDDGIHTAGDITLAGGAVSISAGDDGIHSDTSVLLSGCNVTIPQCYEGIEALTIEQTGGDITIYPTDDGLNANGGSGDGFGFGGPGQGGGRFRMPEGTDGELPTMPEGADGELPTLPEGADGELPTLPEGADGEMPTPPGFDGSGMPTGQPDGESTTGDSAQPLSEANSDTAQTGSDPEQTADQSAEDAWIRISGGTLTIINETGRDADGLDSNGDITITGGVIRISLPGDGSNSAIDYGSESGGVAEISGGTVIACGGSSMAEGFDSTSTQPSFLYNLTETLSAGTALTLTDSAGNELLSWTLPCSASSIAMSCPELVQGETYTLTMGDEGVQITLDSMAVTLGTASGMGGGPGGMGGRGRHGQQAGSTDQSAEGTRSAETSADQSAGPEETKTIETP